MVRVRVEVRVRVVIRVRVGFTVRFGAVRCSSDTKPSRKAPLSTPPSPDVDPQAPLTLWRAVGPLPSAGTYGAFGVFGPRKGTEAALSSSH